MPTYRSFCDSRWSHLSNSHRLTLFFFFFFFPSHWMTLFLEKNLSPKDPWFWFTFRAPCHFLSWVPSPDLLVDAYNWQKWKSTFLKCPCRKIYFKHYDFSIFSKYVKFGAISWKFNILSIAALSNFESKNPFAHMWQSLNSMLQYTVTYGQNVPSCDPLTTSL